MRLVPALDRGLRILSLLAEHGGGMRVSEIARLLDLPRSATYELIHTLVHHYAVTMSEGGEVTLGPQTLALGSAFERRLDFNAIATSTARAVMEETGETVQVGVLDGRSVLYVAKADSRHLVRLVSTVGARLPAHCTALGKVLLANLPEAELAARLGSVELEALTERSLTNAGFLASHLAEVRTQGFATEECESNPDVACVAAPVWDARRGNVAAISISVPMVRVSSERMETMRRIVMTGATQISLQLGAHPPGASPDTAATA